MRNVFLKSLKTMKRQPKYTVLRVTLILEVRNAISDLATTTQQRRKIDAADRELQDEIDKARRQISKSLTKVYLI